MFLMGTMGTMGTTQYLQSFSFVPTSNGRWEQWEQGAEFVPTPMGMGTNPRGMGTAQPTHIQVFTNIVPIVPIVPTKKQ